MGLTRAVVSPLVIGAVAAAFFGFGCGGIGMIGTTDASGGKLGGGGGSVGSGGSGDNGTGGNDNGTDGDDNGTGGSDNGTGGAGTGGAASDGGVDKAPVDAPADRPKTDAGTGGAGGADARIGAPTDMPAIETAPDVMPETKPDAADDGNEPPFFPIVPCATSHLYTAAAD